MFKSKVKKVRRWLAQKIDPSYVRETKIKHEIIDIEIKRQKALTEELARLSLADAIRKRYKSIRPLIAIKELDDLSPDERLSHAAACFALTNNATLRYVLDVLAHNLIETTATKAQTMDEVFFNRASLNGLYLLEETVSLLAGEHEENKIEEPDEEDN